MTPTRTSRAATPKSRRASTLHSRQEGCRCLQGQELRLRNLRRHLHRQGRCSAHLPHRSSLPGLRPRAERSDVPQSIPCRPRVRNCADVHKPIRTCCYTYQQVFAAVTNYLKATYGLVPTRNARISPELVSCPTTCRRTSTPNTYPSMPSDNFYDKWLEQDSKPASHPQKAQRPNP